MCAGEYEHILIAFFAFGLQGVNLVPKAEHGRVVRRIAQAQYGARRALGRAIRLYGERQIGE
jgi:hypothetical protein